MTRMSTNVSSATPSSVGNISKKRLTRYFHIVVAEARPVPRPRAPALLREPDRVELVVEIVAGCDRPAFHLRQMRNDAMPLQRVDDVRLVVEQPLLELAQDLLALFGIGGASLPVHEVVDDGVLVPAVVRVGGADEARQVEVGLDDEAALEVHGDLEVAALEHRMVRGGLDDLLPPVEADLLPLRDEPDAERLVGMRDAAVLEDEREAVRHARFLQQPARLGA